MKTLRHTLLLDPREEATARDNPILGAANISAAELASRAFELPPRDLEIAIADVGDDARTANATLAAMHRPCLRSTAFAYGDATPDAARYRLWRPAAWLEQNVTALPPGCALDLACGSGRDSVFLASLGWDVLGVDLLPDALDQARTLAARYTPDARVRFERRDLESGPVAFDQQFDLIIGVRYLHRPLFPMFATWATSTARVIYETFTTIHRDRHGKPRSDAHVLQPTELHTLLNDWHVERYEEGWIGEVHTARIVARRACTNS